MQITKKQRKHLIINLVLLLLTFVTMITCIVAWFANRTYAEINDVSLQVERTELELKSPIEPILFPCATKIGDQTTTPEYFNTQGAVAREYIIGGSGKVYVAVEAADGTKGLLGYVCDSTTTTDYYAELMPKLKAELGTNYSSWTYSKIQQALTKLNLKAIGELNQNGDTVFKVVYWLEYEEVKNELNSDAYWDSDKTSKPYKAKLIITG